LFDCVDFKHCYMWLCKVEVSWEYMSLAKRSLFGLRCYMIFFGGAEKYDFNLYKLLVDLFICKFIYLLACK